jgi:hypothetical protein
MSFAKKAIALEVKKQKIKVKPLSGQIPYYKQYEILIHVWFTYLTKAALEQI